MLKKLKKYILFIFTLILFFPRRHTPSIEYSGTPFCDPWDFNDAWVFGFPFPSIRIFDDLYTRETARIPTSESFHIDILAFLFNLILVLFFMAIIRLTIKSLTTITGLFKSKKKPKN